jgi:hypothetical protein
VTRVWNREAHATFLSAEVAAALAAWFTKENSCPGVSCQRDTRPIADAVHGGGASKALSIGRSVPALLLSYFLDMDRTMRSITRPMSYPCGCSSTLYLKRVARAF